MVRTRERVRWSRIVLARAGNVVLVDFDSSRGCRFPCRAGVLALVVLARVIQHFVEPQTLDAVGVVPQIAQQPG